MTSAPSTISFGSYTYKGKVVLGSCSSWQSFVSNSLAFSSKDFSVSSLSVAFGTDGSNFTASCGNRSIVNTLIASLRNAPADSGITALQCGGHLWKVFSCYVGGAAVPIFCVNCETTLSANPCYSSCSRRLLSVTHTEVSYSQRNAASAGGAFVLTSVGTVAKKKFPLLSYISANSTLSAVSILVNLSSPGTVRCGALFSGQQLVDVFAIRQSPFYGISWKGDTRRVSVTGLSPDTSYDLYCYSEDFEGHYMDLSAVQATLLNVKTSCCRRVQFSTTDFNIVAYAALSTSSSESVYQFNIGSQPTASASVSLFIRPDSGCANVTSSATSTATALPSVPFKFTSSSSFLMGSFVIRGTVGCYLLTASVKSSDNYVNASSFVQILQIPPAPNMISAAYTRDGSKIIITFNSPTDYSATVVQTLNFTCDKMFNFTRASLTYCVWLTSTQLQLVPGSVSISVGDILFLRRNVLRASCVNTASICQQYSYSSTQKSIVTAPDHPSAPIVSLSAPSTASVCNDLILDPTSSYGRGGRPWKSVSWVVSGSGNVSAIYSILTSKYNDTVNIIRIPQTFLSTGTLTVSLIITNFLGASSGTTVSVDVQVTEDIPTVRIDGPSVISIYRWQPLQLFVNASVSSCVPISSGELTYDWKVFRNGLKYESTLVSSSLNQRFFKLRTYSLSASSVYKITATVTSPSGSLASDSVTVAIGRSFVVASIAQGSAFSISASKSIAIDASLSYDFDYPKSNLTFSWHCSEYFPSYGRSCGVSTNTSLSKLWIQANSLLSKTYNFTVVAIAFDGIRASTSSLVNVTSQSVPHASFGQIATKYNPGDRLAINASIVATDIVVAIWSCLDSSVNLTSRSTTPLYKLLTPGTLVLQLGLSADTLAAGRVYTFQLELYYLVHSSNDLFYTQVTISMNNAPIGGAFTVSPSTGLALNTTFYWTTYDWVDDIEDFPLSYTMGYSLSTDASHLVIVKSSGYTQYVSTTMGAGLQIFDFVVFCTVLAQDIYAATSSAFAEIVVASLGVPSNEELSATLASHISDAQASIDSDLLIQVVSAYTSVINAKNCSAAPNCDLLNRFPCSTTAATCGVCKDGFLGVGGPSNSPCNASSNLRLAGQPCTSDQNCAFGTCVAGLCQFLSKRCPNDCSSNGNCTYYNSYTYEIVQTCSTDTSSCFAECICRQAWHGDDCSVDGESFGFRVALRETMCDAVYKVIDIQVAFI